MKYICNINVDERHSERVLGNVTGLVEYLAWRDQSLSGLLKKLNERYYLLLSRKFVHFFCHLINFVVKSGRTNAF